MAPNDDEQAAPEPALAWRLRSAPGALARAWGGPILTGAVVFFGLLPDIGELVGVEISRWWAIPASLLLPALLISFVWLVRGSRPLAPYLVPRGEARMTLEHGTLRVCGYRVGEQLAIPLEQLELVAGRTFVEIRDRDGTRARELDEHLFEGGKQGMGEFVEVMRAAFEEAGGLRSSRGRHAMLGAVTLSLES